MPPPVLSILRGPVSGGISVGPPVAHPYPPPRVRIYRGISPLAGAGITPAPVVVTTGPSPERGKGTGSYSTANVLKVTAATAVSAFAAEFLGPVSTGDTLVVGLLIGAAVTITPPAGWLAAIQVTTGAIRGGLYYHAVTSSEAGTPGPFTFTFSGPGDVLANGIEYFGVLTPQASALDRTGSTSGSSGAGGSVTVAPTTSPNATVVEKELSVALFGSFATDPFGYSMPPYFNFPSSYTSVQAGSWSYSRLSILMGATITGGPAIQSASATLLRLSAVAWLGLIATFRPDPDNALFTPLGELSACSGSATKRGAEIGSFQLSVPKSDPAAAYISEGSIIEWRIPTVPPLIWEQYIVEHMTDNEDGAEPTLEIAGGDLRTTIAGLEIAPLTIDAVRGTPPTGGLWENWVRAIVTATAITPTGTQYGLSLRVPGLALEAATHNYGTNYGSDPPTEVGAPLGDTFTRAFKVDGLGWGIRMLSPGQAGAKLEFYVYQGVDRRMGTAAPAVFAVKFDTARACTYGRESIGAVNYLTMLGPAAGSVRPTFAAIDIASVQKWGALAARADASITPWMSATIAPAFLALLAPKEWVEIQPLDSPLLAALSGYNLLDRCSALTRDGKRFDGPITAMTLYSTGSRTPAMDRLDPYGLRAPIDTVPQTHSPSLPLTLVLGEQPSGTYAGDKGGLPAALRDYTYLPDLTADAADLNKLVAYTGAGADLNKVGDIATTPGTAEANKAPLLGPTANLDQMRVTTLRAGAGTYVMEDGATRNPVSAVSATAQTVAVLGGLTVQDSTTTGNPAADAAELQTALNALVAYINGLRAAHNTVTGALPGVNVLST